MPHDNKKPSQSEEDEKAKIITIREDSVYNYTDIIDKIAMRKTPHVTKLLRIKAFEPGIYKIRNGMTKRLTGDQLEILDSKVVMWIKLTDEEAKDIIGAEGAAVYGNYLRDMRRYFAHHEMAYQNHPYMFLHNIRGIPRPIQQTLEL